MLWYEKKYGLPVRNNQNKDQKKTYEGMIHYLHKVPRCVSLLAG